MGDRARAWWHLWWDETLIIVGVSTAICLLVWGGWFLFQTMPLPLAEGKVVNRDYRPQYEETHDGGTTCVAWSKGICVGQIQNADIHHTHCVGGCYRLRVYGCSNDRRGTEHCREVWEGSNQGQFEVCAIGQWWTRGEWRCKPR